ncbi:MAG: Flp pilus assembly complex ATPase component TadA, partial [Bdellovibrionales bacterium]|nr:Flp pilus assembly complex ATPase component TadA [Bdellovibrionales bacterium]
EYRLKDITQIQVNPKVGMTFAKGLRAILRQDPDVVMVGEIRDKETATIALQAAQTGHLVLSTIHTNSAAASVTRLLDLEIAPYLIASSVGAVVAQRLVRKLCSCAKPASGNAVEECQKRGILPTHIKEPTGCDQCDHTGYKGRTGIYSILMFEDAVTEQIRKGASERELERADEGFNSLEEEGKRLVAQGVTSLSELERVLGKVQNDEPLRNIKAEITGDTGILEKQSILLVEDDENVRTMLRMILEQDMFEVAEARNGVEALEQIYTKVPTLVLSDIMMPKMSGLDLLARIRKDRRLGELPVLLLTAADDDKNELHALALGVNDFVSKTASKDVMLARIHKMLS